MCALLTTTPVAQSIQSGVWGLSVCACVCLRASMCVPSCMNACINSLCALYNQVAYVPVNACVCVPGQ